MIFAEVIVRANPNERPIPLSVSDEYELIDKIEAEYIRTVNSEEVLYLELYINVAELTVKQIQSYNLSKGRKELSLFDSFGYSCVFKDLFDDLNNSTNLSRKEISDILRKEIACDFVSDKWAIFEFKIPKIKIKNSL